MKFAEWVSATVLAFIFPGCANPPAIQQTPPASPRLPPAPLSVQASSKPKPKPAKPKPRHLDKNKAVEKLVAAMLRHQGFEKRYGILASVRTTGRLPIIVVGDLRTGVKMEHVRDKIDVCINTLSVELFNSGRFDVKKDDASRAIVSRIEIGADGAIENESLKKVLGMAEPPDLIVLGELSGGGCGKDGVPTYRLDLQVYDMATGKTLWMGYCEDIAF